MKRVHIIGPARSGTTLMLELMITGFHFDVIYENETSILHMPRDIKHATVCSKNPQDYKLTGQIIGKDNSVWFISMVRDPRDIVVNHHSRHPDEYWTNI